MSDAIITALIGGVFALLSTSLPLYYKYKNEQRKHAFLLTERELNLQNHSVIIKLDDHINHMKTTFVISDSHKYRIAKYGMIVLLEHAKKVLLENGENLEKNTPCVDATCECTGKMIANEHGRIMREVTGYVNISKSDVEKYLELKEIDSESYKTLIDFLKKMKQTQAISDMVISNGIYTICNDTYIKSCIDKHEFVYHYHLLNIEILINSLNDVLKSLNGDFDSKKFNIGGDY